MKKIYLLLLSIAVFTSTIAQTEPMPDGCKKKMNKRSYKMISFTDSDSSVVMTESKAFIQFDLDSMNISGNDGCNGFFGKIIEIGESKIKLGPTMGTMMYCTELGDKDAKIKALLQRVNKYKLKGKTSLELYEDSKLLMTFGPVKPPKG